MAAFLVKLVTSSSKNASGGGFPVFFLGRTNVDSLKALTGIEAAVGSYADMPEYELEELLLKDIVRRISLVWLDGSLRRYAKLVVDISKSDKASLDKLIGQTYTSPTGKTGKIVAVNIPRKASFVS